MDAAGTNDPAARELVVYTRPGCPFCTSLRAGLRKRGVAFRELDIWQDDEARTVVRSIADGNETVPTVVAGAYSAVNPTASEVVAALGEHAPELLPEQKPGPVQGTLNALGLRRDG